MQSMTSSASGTLALDICQVRKDGAYLNVTAHVHEQASSCAGSTDAWHHHGRHGPASACQLHSGLVQLLVQGCHSGPGAGGLPPLHSFSLLTIEMVRTQQQMYERGGHVLGFEAPG